MFKGDIKEYLEELYNRYNRQEYIFTDPIRYPHELAGNKEFIAFTSAIFAYGNVKAMQKFLYSFFDECGTDPLKLAPNRSRLKYRFQTAADVDSYCLIMKKIYGKHGSLEAFFKQFSGKPLESAAKAIGQIHETLMDNKTQGLNFLFAMPGRSPSKRIAMFLRWMIRKDDVDFGLWSKFSPSELSMPLDTHVQRLSVNLGIISEKEKNLKALEKVNRFFGDLNPQDPVKYDFSLTRLGIALKCKYSPTPLCKSCNENNRCVFN